MKAINSEVPFFRPSLFFVSGICIQLLFCPSMVVLLTVWLSVSSLLVVRMRFASDGQNRAYWYALQIYSLIFFCGLFTTALRQNNAEPGLSQLSPSQLICTIESPPKETPKTVKAVLHCKQYNQTGKSFLLLAYIAKDSLSKQLAYGDRLLVCCRPKRIRNNNNPHGFDMERYMAMKGIHYQVYTQAGQWKLLDRGHGNVIFRMANRCQRWLMSVFRSNGFENREFAVVSALSLGYVDEIDSETRAAFSASGAMHVLSVSGLHVGVVYAALSFMLGFMKRYPRGLLFKTLIEISFLWFFALLSGLSPAVERAAFMLSLVVIAKAYRQEANIFNILLVSLFFLLAYDPFLITDVGFQLSYLAMASLLYFFPYINKWFVSKNYLLSSAWSMTAAALAAQIGTLPLSLYYFHQFPNLFLLSNVVAILLSSVILYGSALLFAFSFSAFFAMVVGKALWWTTWLLNWFIFWVEDQRYSLVERIPFSACDLVLAYIAILLFAVYLSYKRHWLLSASLGFLIACFGAWGYSSWSLKDQHRLIVLSVPKTTAVCAVHSRSMTLLADSSLMKDKEKFTYLTKGLLTGYQIKQVELHALEEKQSAPNNTSPGYAVLQLQGKRLLIFKGKQHLHHPSNKKMDIDYLVLSGNSKIALAKLTDLFTFRQIIIDSSVPAYQSQGLLSECEQQGIACHSIAEHGAWIQNLY